MDDREDFTKAWLYESPQNIGIIETYHALCFNIQDLKDWDITPIDLGSGFRKIELETSAYYWHEENGIITIGVEFSKTHFNLIVHLLGKNPKYKGNPPYAIDLYKLALNDNHILGLMSDTRLSENGFNLWERLFEEGYHVAVYSKEFPGKNFRPIRAKEELKKYFGKDSSFEKYRFAISNRKMIGECHSQFNTRRYRELAGLL
ncbi:Uncharacterised protein [uncultured archaeon]|nr:Uncharacterised protein [uncultured archaeon]